MIIRRRKDMKKFLAGKKDNKGFSLVELIVVILIMGIIAVALAPQVMKWVGKSAESTDESNAATIKSAVQAAVTDFVAQGQPLTENTTLQYYVMDGGIIKAGETVDNKVTVNTPSKDDVLELEQIIANTLGDFPPVKSDSSKCFVITIHCIDKVSATVDITKDVINYKTGQK